MPPRLFALECLGCMKSLLFLLKATVAHRRIKSSKQGTAYERIAITSFQNIFLGKGSHKVRSSPPSADFCQRQHRSDPQGLSCYAAGRCQAQEQCHTSLTLTRSAAGRAVRSVQSKKSAIAGTPCSAWPPWQQLARASEHGRHNFEEVLTEIECKQVTETLLR